MNDKTKIEVPAWALWVIVGGLIVVAIGLVLVGVQLMRQSAALSATPTAQAVVPPTATPVVVTATPAGVPAVTKMNSVDLRSAPGGGGTPMGLLPNGARLLVRARSADNLWLRVETEDGTVGWLMTGTVDLRGASLNLVPQSAMVSLPVSTATSAPTAVPTQPSLVGSTVRVLDSQPVRDAGALNLRAARDTSSALVDKAQIAESLLVLNRVVEADGTVWLLVRSPRNKEGWVREKDGNTLLVALPGQEPLAPITATPRATTVVTATTAPAAMPKVAPTATPRTSPLGTPSAQALYSVKVLDTPVVRGAGALYLRAQRNITATVVDSAAIGETLSVFERVVEADGTPWLRVRSPRGKEGWVREKDGETALVEKVS